MHRERLEMMRDLLREDAANPEGARFDLGMWVGDSEWRNQGRPAATLYNADELGVNVDDRLTMEERKIAGDKLPKIDCGTTACALGLAALSHRFEKFGLTMTWMQAQGHTVQLVPMCNGQDGFEAGAELFGITSEYSQYFFDPDNYRDVPKGAEGELYVAQRIDDYLNGEIDRDWHPDTMYEDDEDDNDY